ncbi:hypothetical protein [Oceanithermus desulfurans]|uniref:Uncharacterized protein n=1 Tax=Oceanithermus desulfurans TaxID=227924 RepID=A0ABR6P3N6_9DEIN|nr:hypothetical protein [Oceanithermus desulfurans]MBB6030056.1 hypothetical protein [Oceanithermus desulfurans]
MLATFGPHLEGKTAIWISHRPLGLGLRTLRLVEWKLAPGR